jgi:hypothetical protein
MSMMLIVREVKEKSRIEIENAMETLQGSNDFSANSAEVLSGRFSFIGHCEKISCRFE